MKQHITKVLLLVNERKPLAFDYLEEIKVFLDERNIGYDIFSFSGAPAQPHIDEYHLAITLGGDGTVLFAARILSPHSIPIFPINLGSLGFIAEVMREEWRENLAAYIDGKLGITERLMLKMQVIRRDEEIASFSGLNDFVVSSSGISKLVQLELFLEDLAIGSYRADGVIISSPTGSTAYSAAAGGPILHPEMDAIIVNPICPFTLSHRPLVFPATRTIEIRVLEDQRTSLNLTVDGQQSFPLEPGDRMTVRHAPYKALLATSLKHNFYDVLREKLNWSGGPDA